MQIAGPLADRLENGERHPGQNLVDIQTGQTPGRIMAVCDYIAGMTDRYAILEHRRIFDIDELA